VVLYVLVTFTGETLALSTDRQQPVTVEADQAELDDAKGVTTYEGRVVVTQGSLRITGDRVLLYYDQSRDVTRAEALGKPATYEQTPDGEQTPVKARALRMEYQVREGVIDLYDEAEVLQERDSLRGRRITYDTVNNRVKAMGSGSPEDRVRVILTPRGKAGFGPGAGHGGAAQGTGQGGGQGTGQSAGQPGGR
jgi:lipopolysaccharide export system protein LptA